EIDLIIRGMCALRPGVRGVSDRIRVSSIVGRFLEHTRIFYFANGGQDSIYLSSADWMPRNLYERVEVMFPVKDAMLRDRIPHETDGIDHAGFVRRPLAAVNAQVDVIISSPLNRATQTASLIGNEIGYEGKLQLEPALRPEASFADFRRMLEKYLRHEAVMVVGHNPSITDFLSRMIAKSGCEAIIDFKKGAVARAETVRHSATLNWFLTPKIAREIQAAAMAAAEKSHPKTSRK